MIYDIVLELSREVKIMQTASVREEVHKLADQLSDDATWDDVAHSIYVRQKVAKGLEDIEAGRTLSHEEVKNKWKVKLADQMD